MVSIGVHSRCEVRAFLAAALSAILLCARCASEPRPQGNDVDVPVAAEAERGRRPNVILILSDDHASGLTGLEGNPEVQTPTLDRLAREGVFFSRAYVPIPQCAPSRAAILTGLYPHQNGVTLNAGMQLKSDAVTFSDLFAKQGYACGLIGKWHLGNVSTPQAGFVDTWVTLVDPLLGYRNSKLWVNGEITAPLEQHLTKALVDYAIGFVEDHSDGPFLLWLALKAPHAPFDPPARWREAYDPESLRLPVSMADDLSTKPAPQRAGWTHQRYLETTEKEIREQRALYYAMISCLDFHVGRLMYRLEELGLDENTLVIYASDNGLAHGEHQMVAKGPAFYEELVRVPMILRWPGRIEPGQRIDALVSTLDLFPTMCRAAGVAVPTGLAGRDLSPLWSGRESKLRDALFFEFFKKSKGDEVVPMRGLVTERHKYVRYLDNGEELYDLHHDPHEMENLAGAPTERKLLESMRSKLAAWRVRTRDTP